MVFFKNLADKAKEKVNEVKNNVSKQDFLDLVSDYQKTIAEGGRDDATENKATVKFLKGLGQMATGKYEGASRKLESVHKDPYDIQMAEEAKNELNLILREKLNSRKFIYADPTTTDEAGLFIVKTIGFTGLVKDQTLLPRIREYLDSNGIHYDASALDSEIKNFIHDKEITQLRFIREQVDKYIFIDRMTKDEVVKLYEKYTYNTTPHYRYVCEYCGCKFEKMPPVGNDFMRYPCPKSPSGVNRGPHKVHSIGQEKLWVD